MDQLPLKNTLDLLADMENFSVDWDEGVQNFNMQTKVWDAESECEKIIFYNTSNYQLKPFFLYLERIFDSEILGKTELVKIGGRLLFHMLNHHYNKSQLVVRGVRVHFFSFLKVF